MSKKGDSNIIAVITMIFLFGMIAFVTNLAAPIGNIWKMQPGIEGSNTLGMMGNMMNFLAYAIMGIPAGNLLKKKGYKFTALAALLVGLLGVFVQYLSGIVGVGSTIGKIPMIKPTYLVLVPGLCEILIGLSKMYGPQFLGGSLKMIISGAANVPPRLQVEFEKLGINLCAGYGMTETANLTTANANVKERPTSIGKLYPGQEAKIVDGELWVKGDNLFLGYYKDEANTKATLTEDGWIKTGDLARVDEDGFYYIVGRIKNLILLPNGENVSPESIEELFYQNPLVRDCLVSEGDNNGTPCIAIDILPQMAAFDGQAWEEVVATMEKIVSEINAKLPSYEKVVKVSVRKEDFKRTGSMKVARNQN